MNTLMTEGAKYGAKFGIHVNAGEMYPEAKAFKDDNVRRYADGSLRYGWNWLDQAVDLDSKSMILQQVYVIQDLMHWKNWSELIWISYM